MNREHLGSIDSVSDAAGARAGSVHSGDLTGTANAIDPAALGLAREPILNRQAKVRLSYGAFGKRRNEAGWAGSVPIGDLTGIANTTRHGYTEHEMLDNLTLTHMNGRVFDQTIGRFISADPFVQAPDFSQSLNRYSYVWNNPLSFTDPSGFETERSPFGFGFGYGAVRVAHHRYPAPHMQPPPRKDAPVGRDTQATVQGAPSPNGADSGLDSSASCAGIEGATPGINGQEADPCQSSSTQVQIIGLCEDGSGELCDLTELEGSDIHFGKLGAAVGARWDFYWEEEFLGDATIAVSVTSGVGSIRWVASRITRDHVHGATLILARIFKIRDRAYRYRRKCLGPQRRR